MQKYLLVVTVTVVVDAVVTVVGALHKPHLTGQNALTCTPFIERVVFEHIAEVTLMQIAPRSLHGADVVAGVVIGHNPQVFTQAVLIFTPSRYTFALHLDLYVKQRDDVSAH